MIHLEEITNRNVWDIAKLKVAPSQEDFVATNLQSLAEAYATRNEGNNALPLGIYDGETPVGFVMLGKGSIGESEENEPEELLKGYCIWRLMIDSRYQKRGFGKQAMTAILDKIRTFPFGESDFVWLSYEPENEVAKRFYTSFGFIETGEILEGEAVAVRSL